MAEDLAVQRGATPPKVGQSPPRVEHIRCHAGSAKTHASRAKWETEMSTETNPWRNDLTPNLVDAIVAFIAGTPDPCAITDALSEALIQGGMSDRDIAAAVEKFLRQN